MPFRSLTLLAIAGALSSTPLAAEDSAATIADLRRQLDALDQRVRIIDRKNEIAAEEAAAKARTASSAKAGADGFTIGTADGAFRLKFGLLAQADARVYVDDDLIKQSNSFLVRRGQPTLDAQLTPWARGFLQTNFTGSQTSNATAGQPATQSVQLLEAWVEGKAHDLFALRAGRSKVIGLEYINSTGGLFFPERGLPTNLVPGYDIGGTVTSSFGSYGSLSLGVFNGAVDGGVKDGDSSDDKDAAARLSFTPFKKDGGDWVKGLNLVLAGTWGNEGNAPSSATNGPLTAGYRSPGQATTFTYSANVFNRGERSRLAPAIEWYAGPFAALAEYTQSTVEVRRGAREDTLTHSAWQLVAGWVITGENRSASGVTPKKPFDPAAGGWGAFEVVGRVGQLSLDDDAFTGTTATSFAARNSAISEATSFGVGVNWWLTRNLRASVSGDLTQYTDGAGTAGSPQDRETEKVAIGRLQANF